MRNMSMLDYELDESVFVRLIQGLEPGQALTGAMVLTALEGEGEAEAFEEMDLTVVPLDISDLPKALVSGQTGDRLALEQRLAQEGKLLEDLAPSDPLRLYLEEIAAIPAFGDLGLLAGDLAAANEAQREEPQLLQRIMNLCLSRVVQIATEYTGYGVLLQDLIQEGSMALWSQLPRFRAPELPDFEKLRDHVLHYSMKKTVLLQAHENGVGQKMRQAMEDYRAVDQQLLMDLGRNPTLEEIAEGLHLEVDAAAAVAMMLENARLVGQARQEPEEETQEEELAVEDTAYFQMRQRITELLSSLTEREAKVLTLRFGLEGGLPLDGAQTARKLGMTPAEVAGIEANAIGKLRKEQT